MEAARRVVAEVQSVVLRPETRSREEVSGMWTGATVFPPTGDEISRARSISMSCKLRKLPVLFSILSKFGNPTHRIFIEEIIPEHYPQRKKES
jgi:hypothetical protein